MAWLRERSGWLVLLPALVLLAVGIGCAAAGLEAARDASWIAAGAIGLVTSVAAVVRGILHRSAGVDVLALLAVAGALATGEYLAAALIAVMLGTGTVLDQWAEASARRELRLLLARSPRVAHRVTSDSVEQVDVAAVRIADTLLIGSGEIVPVDARLIDGGTFDESALTGESAPVERAPGQSIKSGIVNAGSPVRAVATQTAENSTYADVVRMVEAAQAETSPYVRFADRIAWWFIPLSLLVAGGAWLVSGDPTRAVAVLVVATPCPLLLAVPVAIISGVSQAAKRGVVIKGGQVLEQLAGGRVLLFDKTGTLTVGHPSLQSVHVAPGLGVDEVVQAAASLDQASPHVLAGAIVQSAGERGLELDMPDDVTEVHGFGIRGVVRGRSVAVGKAAWILQEQRPEWARRARHEADLEGCVSVLVAIDGQPAGALLLLDTLRPESPRMLRRLRSAGFQRTILVSGDRTEVADTVGRLAGVDAVRAEQTPADKVTVVREERAHGPVVMVGDGINDAPALAAADIGVAMAGRGATASSEAAGVVLTVDRIDRLADAVTIARRARRIAAQSAWLGMGLSGVAMLAAAVGLLPAAAGALLQEVIDVLAIGNALRVGLVRPKATVRMSPDRMELLVRTASEHEEVKPITDRIRATADALGAGTGNDALAPVRELLVDLDGKLLPHERREELELLPAMAPTLGGLDPVGALSRTHAEIEHLVGKLHRIAADPDLPTDDAINEARRTLYVLYGVLQLHNAQEDEGLFSLIDQGP